MQASQRLLEIEQAYEDQVQSIVPIELDDETLRLIIHLYDDSSLRVTEQWDGAKLARYSYYWLTQEDALLIGWDNSPHHKTILTFPHHKHVGQQRDLQASRETCLEDVMRVVLAA